MIWKRAEVEGFIDPRWYRECLGKTFPGVVANGHKISVNGLKISCEDYPCGTEVIVAVSRNVTVTSKAEFEYERLQRINCYISDSMTDFSLGKLRYYQGVDSAKNLPLPFHWSAARLDVLSGLSENSWGDGCKSNTVHHILLHEDFKTGRLTRTAGSYLCGADKRATGNYSGTNGSPVEFLFSGQSYVPAITCKRCLSLSDRIIKKTYTATEIRKLPYVLV